MPDLYGGSVVKPFLGRVVLKKLAGAGPISVGAQVIVPHASAQPRNPLNTSYLSGINSTGYLSGDVAGKRTPSCTLTTVVKTGSYFTANLLNSLILSVDANGDSDVWAILLDDLYSPVIYDGAKCSGLHLRQFATGGPMALTMSFVSMYGDGENPGTIFGPTTFSSTSTDPGAITDVTKVTYAGTADLVQSFSMDIVRPQSYVFYDDGTIFPAGVATGLLNGAVTLTQSVKYSETWGSTGAVHIGQTGAGVAIALSVSRKEDVRDFKADSRTAVRTYQLYDSGGGGAPVIVSAL